MSKKDDHLLISMNTKFYKQVLVSMCSYALHEHGIILIMVSISNSCIILQLIKQRNFDCDGDLEMQSNS